MLAYDVEKNADVFYKDVPDGVQCMTFGQLPSIDKALIIIGGHCSIQVRQVSDASIYDRTIKVYLHADPNYLILPHTYIGI